MNKLFAAGLLASTALAAGTSPVLKGRQLVEIPCSESGMQDCGDGCIDLGWTCCPSGDGGCGPGFYCHSEGGCCPDGEVCQGDGGVITEPGVTVTNTIPVEVPTDIPGSSTPVYSTPTPSASPSASYTYPTQAPAPTFTGAADRVVGSGVASFAGIIAGLFML